MNGYPNPARTAQQSLHDALSRRGKAYDADRPHLEPQWEYDPCDLQPEDIKFAQRILDDQRQGRPVQPLDLDTAIDIAMAALNRENDRITELCADLKARTARLKSESTCG